MPCLQCISTSLPVASSRFTHLHCQGAEYCTPLRRSGKRRRQIVLRHRQGVERLQPAVATSSCAHRHVECALTKITTIHWTLTLAVYSIHTLRLLVRCQTLQDSTHCNTTCTVSQCDDLTHTQCTTYQGSGMPNPILSAYHNISSMSPPLSPAWLIPFSGFLPGPPLS